MTTKFTFLVGALLTFTMTCGIVNSMLGLTNSAGTVSELWSDVPPLEGAAKADLEMPLAFQLMIKAMTRGGVDYIAFTTPQTPDDIKGYYTTELMQSNGWQAVDMEGKETGQQSCVGDQSGTGSAGALCLFSKGDDQNQTLLAIVIAQNEQSKQTDVFFARIDASKFETPSSGG
jgi:hypothetical protein